MILAYHSILSAYGFWLPNDPRGSWSDFVRSWELFRFGPATKTDARHSVADRPHDATARRLAKGTLRYPPVQFTGRQAQSIGVGFARAIDESQYRIWACAILPEHVHVVIARDNRRVERIVGHLKIRATQQLLADRRHPLADHANSDSALPSPWGRRAWQVYLDNVQDLAHAIAYVQDNPAKEGKPPQHWAFVTQDFRTST